jgi:hypothetical protein
MKNVEIWSRSVDRKLMAVGCSLSALALAAGLGYAYPVPRSLETIRAFNALVTAALLVFVWTIIHLMCPSRPNTTWKIAEGFGIPLLWMLLVALFLLWVHSSCLGFTFDRDALAPLVL